MFLSRLRVGLGAALRGDVAIDGWERARRGAAFCLGGGGAGEETRTEGRASLHCLRLSEGDDSIH